MPVQGATDDKLQYSYIPLSLIIGQLYYNIKAVYIQFESVERKLSMLRVGAEREIKIWCTDILLIIALIKSCVTTTGSQSTDRFTMHTNIIIVIGI